jgi:SAM-dependent methyltransferase
MSPKWRLWWRRQQFRPSAISILFNPSFLLRRRLFHALRRHLRDTHGIALDIGCGSKPYRSLTPASVYVGIEVNQTGHSHAKESVDVTYDGSALPFANASFDLVLCSEVLEHAGDPNHLLREIDRILRPGALLVLTVPFAWGEHEQPYDDHRWTFFGLSRLLTRTGFPHSEIERSGHHLEAIAQLFAAYLHQCILPRNKVLNAAIVPVLISPVLAIGWASTLLPAKNNLYMNLIAVAKKPSA